MKRFPRHLPRSIGRVEAESKLPPEFARSPPPPPLPRLEGCRVQQQQEEAAAYAATPPGCCRGLSGAWWRGADDDHARRCRSAARPIVELQMLSAGRGGERSR